MRKLCVFFAIAVLMLPCAVSAEEEFRPSNRRIVGGKKTNIEKHPWQVALNVSLGGENYLCGGSIISPHWVLTAAHCFAPSTGAGAVRVKSGVTDYLKDGTWVDIERVIIHERYNSKTKENDIALVKLKSPTPPTTRVITLAPATMMIPIRQPLEVTGWGATREDGSSSKELLKATVPLANPTECNSARAYNGALKAGMMCAGYREGGIDACQGDSGGPLVWNTPDGPILVGVVSWGYGCARKLKYGIYTRVSDFRDWINQSIGAGQN